MEEINRNELMSKKHKKVCKTLSYIKHDFILSSTIAGCISISGFSYFTGFLVRITSYVIGLLICAIAAGIRKCKSIIKKKKKKYEKIVLLAKSKFNSTEVLSSKALIDSNISHDKFALINSVLKEYDEMKEQIKHLKT